MSAPIPNNKHLGISLMLIPMDDPGITINGIWTMGDERTNEVWLDNVFVPDEFVVGEVNHGFKYISQALDLERFTMFTYAPIKQRLDVLTEYVQETTRDGEPLKDDPMVRSKMANLHTEAEVARVMGLKFVAEAVKVEHLVREGKPYQPPTVVASEYKLFATELSKRLASSAMDIGGAGCPAPGEDRGRSDGRPFGVDLPLHRHRHHRRRRLGDPEEHHRPSRSRPSEELLT